VDRGFIFLPHRDRHKIRWLIIILLLPILIAACSSQYSYRLRPNPQFCEDIGKDCR
jgi:hypothetical protein